MKYLWRIPSKTIQYGYAEVEVEFATPEEAGHQYRELVSRFQNGELAQKNIQQATKVANVIISVPDDDDAVIDAASDLISKTLGATDITDLMNEDVEEETPEWEQPPPKPSDDDWDFG